MTESKFDDDHGGESKFADKGESKFAEAQDGESKFAESSGTEESTSIVEHSSIFGKDPIIGKLVEYWGKTLAEDINTFFHDNCHHFDEDPEHKLIYTKLHKKYEKIVEKHLQAFREDQDLSESEFYSRVREATDASELAQMIIELVLCCADFQCFVDIMRSKSRSLFQNDRVVIQEASCVESKA